MGGPPRFGRDRKSPKSGHGPKRRARGANEKTALRSPPALFEPSTGPPLAPLRSRRAAEDPRTDQAQHQRESRSAFPAGFAGDQGGGRWPAAALPESHRAGAAREARGVSPVRTSEHHRRQRLRRI